MFNHMASLFDTKNHIKLDPSLKYSLFTVDKEHFSLSVILIQNLYIKVEVCADKKRSGSRHHSWSVVVMIAL